MELEQEAREPVPRGRLHHLEIAALHPHAGGADHDVAYLQNTDGFEIELVTDHGASRP
ncbi:MAG: hypothetical protein L0H86_10315 [Micrococcaceae bacterium]|nr:hypothetical protein [Micrococcaceae bacterium]MDN5906003.1 hypothetical protein [Micrococcaceae bacterium]